MPFVRRLYALLGRRLGNSDLVAIFSARLDETGTDGTSPFVVVGGAVSTAAQWSKLETAWDRLLGRKVAAYHWKEFQDGKDDFSGWSTLKRQRFVERQERIVTRNTLFRVAVGVEHSAHAEIKNRMKGITGFSAHSDYGLCFRYLLFWISEQLAKRDRDHQLTLMLESGPWSSGAARVYEAVSSGRSKHSHRLAGLVIAPKGKYRSLEAADYVAGSEHARITPAGWPRQPGTQRLSVLLDRPKLEQWYEQMIKEKEARRAYGRRLGAGR